MAANKAYIKLPDKLLDHQRQSLRFISSIKVLSRLFGRNFIRQQFKYPKKEFLKLFLLNLFLHPCLMSLYFFIFIKTRIIALKHIEADDLWEISATTKNLES